MLNENLRGKIIFYEQKNSQVFHQNLGFISLSIKDYETKPEKCNFLNVYFKFF